MVVCNSQRHLGEGPLDVVTAENERPLARAEAKSVARIFKRYGNAVATVLWNRLLQRVNSVIGHGNRKVVTYGCRILNFS